MKLSEIEALFKDKESGADLRRFVDGRVQKAVSTFREGHPSDDGLAERLDRLERGAGAKLRAADLRFYLYRKCTEAGVDFGLLSDFPFKDEAGIDAKVSAFGALATAARTRTVNETLANGFRPGSGNGVPSRPDVRKLTPQAAIELESADALDSILGGG